MRTGKHLLLLCIAAAALNAATDAGAQSTSPAGSDVVVVHVGALLDRPGRPPRGPSTIIIREGRVTAVENGATPGPTGARIVDLRDRFVLPGLIDCHVHLQSDLAGVEAQLATVTASLPARAYEAAVNARKTVEAGFTTVRNLGDRGGVTLALRDAIARGDVVGPRILDAGMPISTTAGHTDGRLGFAEPFHEAIAHDNLCDGPESCRRAVRAQIARGADVIKIATTGGVNSRISTGLGAQMFADEARALVDTAHLYGRRVAAHAHGASGIKLALEAGVDSIEHGTLLDDAGIRLLLARRGYLVPTLSTVNGYRERLAANPSAYSPEVRAKIEWRIGATGKALRAAHARGVRIALGSDAGVSKHGRNADELVAMVEHGMSPAAAIKAATFDAAELLGLAAEVGSLEPGKRADLVAVTGDPTKNVAVLQRIAFVMKDGKVVKER